MPGLSHCRCDDVIPSHPLQTHSHTTEQSAKGS
jgi:hypothetical protein